MNSKICFILLAGLATADGSTLRGAADNRELVKTKRISICQKIETGVYETRLVRRWQASLTANAFRGACETLCDTLCTDYPTFEVSGGKCTCIATSAAISEPQCGTNAEVVSGDKCQCLPGYEGDANVACTKKDVCAAKTCASNQICNDTSGVAQCEPILCANPYGNPCGPGSACSDTASGYTCKPLYGSNVCPAGCGPDSSCVNGKCICNDGFYRPQPYLGCEAKP